MRTSNLIYVETKKKTVKLNSKYFINMTYIQGIHKRMVRFQKSTRNLFLSLRGHNVHRQQRQLSKFLMRYQQFVSHAYCGSAGPVSEMASQHEKAFCVLRFEVSKSVITVHREFRARFGKDARMRNLDSCRCWRCTLCPRKVRNEFLVNFWNRTILLCVPCVCIVHHVHITFNWLLYFILLGVLCWIYCNKKTQNFTTFITTLSTLTERIHSVFVSFFVLLWLCNADVLVRTAEGCQAEKSLYWCVVHVILRQRWQLAMTFCLFLLLIYVNRSRAGTRWTIVSNIVLFTVLHFRI